MIDMVRDTSQDLKQDCRLAVERIRAALREVFDRLEVDPLRPQEVSRRYGLNKNLTWKVARIISAEDPLDAVAVFPGPEGFEIFLRRMETERMPAVRIEAVREALRSFRAVVGHHLGDRASLELLIDTLCDRDGLEAARKMAFKAQSAILGMQAKARFTMQIVVPGRPDPTDGLPRFDLVLLVGLIGVRQLRLVRGLPLLRVGMNDPSTPGPALPLVDDGGEEDADGAARFVLREFSSLPPSGLLARRVGAHRILALGDVALGRTGEFDMVYGVRTVGSGTVVATEGDDVSRFISRVSVPSEAAVVDLFVHRDFPEAAAAQCRIYSNAGPELRFDDELSLEAARLPIPSMLEDLDPSGPATLPEVPAYRRLCEVAFAAAGFPCEEFLGKRIRVPYPPIPSSIAISYPMRTA